MNLVKQLQSAIEYSVTQPVAASAFDRRSLPVYYGLAVIFAIQVVVLLASDFYLGSSRAVTRYPYLALLLGIALYLRRRHLTRIGLLMEAIALPTIAGGLAVSGTTFLAAISGPFVDGTLDAADKAIGFDFVALLEFYRANPTISVISRYVYFSFTLQLAFAPFLLALANMEEELWIYITGWCIALFTAVILFPLAPAEGPFAFHGIQEDVFHNFKRFYPWETGPTIEALRNGTLRDVGAAARGLISIPSFHAVGAIYFISAAWHSTLLRWPVLILNLCLIASTVVTGAHYLVDIIAGIALAIFTLALARRIVRHPSLELTPNQRLAPAV